MMGCKMIDAITALNFEQALSAMKKKDEAKTLQTQDDERVYLFSNGTQYADWQDNNCPHCWHFDPTGEGSCPVFEILQESFFGDGSFDRKDAAMIGYPDEIFVNWPCRSAVWADDEAAKQADNWKEKYRSEKK